MKTKIIIIGILILISIFVTGCLNQTDNNVTIENATTNHSEGNNVTNSDVKYYPNYETFAYRPRRFQETNN
ncbi:hypothetical protein [Methanolapillus millepedarum]|uniref:Uncharacterized protein n=1 Tax=Methanolapillus millepedarum TaxID=3028296 RepID=A0AA96V400_9EURY|nr:hypothetical protein MsAc7_10770 [Methanosarcinaceae archaeon Ac7]